MATFPGHLEAAFGADRSGDPLSFDWTDLTDRVNQDRLTISRYRQSAGAAGGDAPPSGFSVLLANGDGALTPRKAGTTPSYYPDVRRGTTVRHHLTGGTTTLTVDGTSPNDRASTPDAASLDITGPLAGAVQFRSPVRMVGLGGASEVYMKWGAAGQRSWRLILGDTGTANFQWSVDGTATTGEAVTSLAIPRPDSGPLTVAWEFDNDNGAGGNTTTWYVLRGTITELLADKTAYVFGDADVISGTTSIFASTATLDVGNGANSNFTPYAGGIDRVFLRSGTLDSGTIAADADFSAEAAGTTSFADDAATPKTWTITAPAEITDRKITCTGQLVANTAAYPGHGVDGTAQRTWEIAGVLRRLRQGRQAKPLRSALYRHITRTAAIGVNDVAVYFPLEDGRDATTAFSPIGGDPSSGVSMSLAADDTLDASQPLPSVSGGQPFGWNLSFPVSTSTSAWEHTMLVKVPVAPDSGASEFLDLQRINLQGGVTSQWVLRVDDTDFSLFAKDLDGTNVLSTTFAPPDTMFGNWTIVILTIDLVGLNITWDVTLIPLDGSGVGFSTNGTLASLGAPAGAPVRLINLMASAPQEGASFGHFTITEGVANSWLAPADSAYVGEPGTTRFARLCVEQNIPALIDGPWLGGTAAGWATAVAAGAKPMGPQRPLPFLTLLSECETIEAGIMGESRELLGLTLRSGSSMLNQAPRLSLTGEVVPPLTPVDDDRDLVNAATVTRPNGSSAEYINEASADDDTGEGLYEGGREINAYDDSQLLPYAAWMVSETTVDEERYDAVNIELAKDAGSAADWQDFCAGDVLEATSLPDPERSGSLTQIVNGWTDTIGAFTRTVKANTRAATPWTVGTLDADPTAPDTDLARIDSSGTTLAGSLSSSATGGQSVTVAGTLWTTSASYQPLIIRIDEEQIELSAISGGSSPQTFTIATRGVNGTTAAAHDAGAEIHVAAPIRVSRSRSFP